MLGIGSKWSGVADALLNAGVLARLVPTRPAYAGPSGPRRRYRSRGTGQGRAIAIRDAKAKAAAQDVTYNDTPYLSEDSRQTRRREALKLAKARRRPDWRLAAEWRARPWLAVDPDAAAAAS